MPSIDTSTLNRPRYINVFEAMEQLEGINTACKLINEALKNLSFGHQGEMQNLKYQTAPKEFKDYHRIIQKAKSEGRMLYSKEASEEFKSYYDKTITPNLLRLETLGADHLIRMNMLATMLYDFYITKISKKTDIEFNFKELLSNYAEDNGYEGQIKEELLKLFSSSAGLNVTSPILKDPTRVNNIKKYLTDNLAKNYRARVGELSIDQIKLLALSLADFKKLIYSGNTEYLDDSPNGKIGELLATVRARNKEFGNFDILEDNKDLVIKKVQEITANLDSFIYNTKETTIEKEAKEPIKETKGSSMASLIQRSRDKIGMKHGS